jgi:hypothetical protein
MRTRTVAALALMLALAAGGCARAETNDPQVASAQTGTATPSASPSATASEDPDAPLKFSQCMRAQGISWFPDPVGGRMDVNVPRGQDHAKMDAAQQACKKFMPNGGVPPKMSAEMLEQARNLAKCMREHGLPNFPDPDPNGALALDAGKLGAKPGDTTFDKADAACAQFRPKSERVEEHSDGGGTSAGKVG